MQPKMKYQEIMRAERRVDCYGGDTFDQHIPLWRAYCDGDRDSSDLKEVVLGCGHFPAGTIVTVSVPVCPKCHQDADMCTDDEACDFDWRIWAEEQYA